MSVLTTNQKIRLGQPPRPPGPRVRRVDAQGNATAPQVEFETRLDEWLRKLVVILSE